VSGLFPLAGLSSIFPSRSRQPPARPLSHAASFQLPLLGGTLRIELRATPDPVSKPHARVLTELQDRSKLGGRRPSDAVESMKWEVVWEPAPLALGIALTIEGVVPAHGELTVVRVGLDLRGLTWLNHMRTERSRSRLRTPRSNGY
jgi:mediator of RNA polymerase II transcription subunit 14